MRKAQQGKLNQHDVTDCRRVAHSSPTLA
jgi:hypothetical protein